MRGPQGDRQCHTRHSGNVSDIVEGRCCGISGISFSLDAVALSAFRMGQLASLLDVAELLRACTVIRQADCNRKNQSTNNNSTHCQGLPLIVCFRHSTGWASQNFPHEGRQGRGVTRAIAELS